MPYFAFALSYPLWLMIQFKKIMDGSWAPEGVNPDKTPK